MPRKSPTDSLPPNAFVGRADAPTEADLQLALGPLQALWDEALAVLARDCGAAEVEWKSYSLKSGWALRVLRGKRTIVWLAVCQGGFRISLVLGENAMQQARGADLPPAARKIVDDAPHYPEGWGLRFQISGPADLAAPLTLASIKARN
jgi:hypothetical protein